MTFASPNILCMNEPCSGLYAVTPSAVEFPPVSQASHLLEPCFIFMFPFKIQNLCRTFSAKPKALEESISFSLWLALPTNIQH